MNPLASKASMPRMNMIDVVRQIRSLQQNPNGMADFLKQRGVINDQQYKQVQQMGGNYAQIGQYLVDNGVMPQQQMMQAYQTAVPQIQNQLR